MLRILFVATPGHGHVQPLLGLVLAAREAGHRVAFATGGDSAALLGSLGLEHVDVGRPFGECLAELRRQLPELAPGRDHARHAFARLFGGIVAPAMLAPLVDCVTDWQPDLIVCEPAALAAPLVARRSRLPLMTHDFGLPVPELLLRAAADMMAPAWQAAGLDVPDDAGVYHEAAVQIVPESMRAHGAAAPRARQVLAQQPASVNAAPDQRLPESLQTFLQASSGRRPLIAVGFGTLHAGGPAWQALLRALRKTSALDVVITVGPLAELPTEYPPNWWVGRYLPYSALLPHCHAVISHGGAGMSLAAAALGLPQLCLPQGADHFRNADALAACGAAQIIEGTLQQADLEQAIERLLDDPLLRQGARRLQREFESRPTAAETAAGLSTLVGRG